MAIVRCLLPLLIALGIACEEPDRPTWTTRLTSGELDLIQHADKARIVHETADAVTTIILGPPRIGPDGAKGFGLMAEPAEPYSLPPAVWKTLEAECPDRVRVDRQGIRYTYVRALAHRAVYAVKISADPTRSVVYFQPKARFWGERWDPTWKNTRTGKPEAGSGVTVRLSAQVPVPITAFALAALEAGYAANATTACK